MYGDDAVKRICKAANVTGQTGAAVVGQSLMRTTEGEPIQGLIYSEFREEYVVLTNALRRGTSR